MRYISSACEVDDYIELSLLRNPPLISAFDRIHVSLTPPSRVVPLASFIETYGIYHLVLDQQTASWALLDEKELAVYKRLARSNLLTLSKENDWNSPEKIIRFIKALYRRGLVSIDGIFPIDPHLFGDRPPFRDAFVIELLITDRCNLACRYCQANAAPWKRDMTIQIAEETVRRAFQLPGEDLLLEISGGEPLLRRDIVKVIASTARHKEIVSGKRVIVNLVTNGTLLQSIDIDLIRKFDISPTVSLDGPDPLFSRARPNRGHGQSWPLVESGLRQLRDAEISFGTVLTVSSQNCKFAREISEFLVDLNPGSVKMNPVYTIGRGKINSSILVSARDYLDFMKTIFSAIADDGMMIKEFVLSEIMNRLITRFRDYRCMRASCNSGVSQFVVTPDGNIFPCALMTNISHASMGNILTHTIRFDHLGVEHPFVQRLSIRSPLRIESCIQCEWSRFCEAGCVAQLCGETQSLFERLSDPLCEFYKGMYRHVMTRLANSPASINQYLKSRSFGYGPGRVYDEIYF